MSLRFSARNQLRAKVKSVKLGAVMAEVIVELADGQEIVSAITRTSAESSESQGGGRCGCDHQIDRGHDRHQRVIVHDHWLGR